MVDHNYDEKVLWKRPTLPDNHIRLNSFLSSLRKNPNFTRYTYWPLVHLTFAVTQQLAITFLFLAVFVYLKQNLLDPRTLISLSVACYVLGYFAWVLVNWNSAIVSGNNDANLKMLKSSILVFFALMSLSSVLRTLSAATSSDSIWAISAVLFCINILLTDYRVPKHGETQEHLSSVLSINAAISASVVLASRLATDIAVFALMLFSVQAFALFPILRRRLRGIIPSLQAWLTLLLVVPAMWFTIPLSRLVAGLYSIMLAFITFAAPAILVWAQKYKNEIRGPWDVAVPKVK